MSLSSFLSLLIITQSTNMMNYIDCFINCANLTLLGWTPLGCHYLFMLYWVWCESILSRIFWYVGGVCNFLGSVSLQQRFEMGDQCYSSVKAQFYLASKGSIPSRCDGGQPQRRGLNPSWLPPFIYLSSLPFEPALCKLGWPRRGCVCFTWSSHSGLWIFFRSVFVGFSLSLILAKAILDSFFLF